jgi:pimeloyl-ACP methyl ester carboxylesterase
MSSLGSGETTDANAATPVVFGPPHGSLFGFYHPPHRASARATGVVLCNPLGYDAMCVHQTYRLFAERLAEQGFPALRFDYHGTGDSSGHPGEPGRVRSWLDSVAAAIEELYDRSAVGSIALFGVRFGATLAAAAAAERGGVADLILWAPSASGRLYVRELRAFRLMKEREAPTKPRIDSDEEVAGYLFDRTVVSDISALDLFARKERVAERVLIVARDDLPGGEDRLTRHFEATGAEATLATQPGYADMMRDAQHAICPLPTLNAMIAWLREAPERASRRSSPSRGAPRVLTASNQHGDVVKEQAFQFGEGQRLFGILTEPAERPVRDDGPAILLLNVGANYHVGPNRMYVSMARDLASRGYLVLRFDVAGLGDSHLAPGARENRLYSKDSVGDVKTAMDLLGRVRASRRFVLLGLCSGAYLAFHTAVEDPRVVGQVLLNPQTFEWKEGDSLELSSRQSFLSTRYYAAALYDPRVWRRTLRGLVNVRGIVGVLRTRLMARTRSRVQSLIAKVRGRTPPRTEVEQAFLKMSDRGIESLLVFSFNDGGIDMIEKHLGGNARRMAGRKNFHLAIVEGADHTFTPIGSQQALYDIVTRYVTERWG